MIKGFISHAGVTGRRELVFHARKKLSQVAGMQLLKCNVSSCSCCSQVQKNCCDTSDGMVLPIAIHGAKPEEVGY